MSSTATSTSRCVRALCVLFLYCYSFLCVCVRFVCLLLLCWISCACMWHVSKRTMREEQRRHEIHSDPCALLCFSLLLFFFFLLRVCVRFLVIFATVVYTSVVYTCVCDVCSVCACGFLLLCLCEVCSCLRVLAYACVCMLVRAFACLRFQST